MSTKISTRDITEGAVMIAISVALLLGSMFIPMFGAVLMLAVAIPLTLLVVRRGMPTAVTAAVVAALLVTFLLGPLSGIRYILMYLPLALAVGWMFSRRKGAGKTMVVSVLCGALSMALMMLLGVAITGFSIETLSAQMNASIDMMIQMYQQTGLMEQMAAQGITEEAFRSQVQGMYVFLPSILVIMGGVMGVSHFLLSRFTMRKLKMKIPRMPQFNQWYLPSVSIWGLIIAWTGWLLTDYLQLSVLCTFCLNIMVIYGALLFFTGLSVLAYYMKFKELNTGMKILIVVFALFFLSGVLLLSLLAGLFDLIFDFRKLRKGKDKATA